MHISGTTKLVGLIGWPIHYTKSPAMHNAAYKALGVDYVYVPLRVEPAHHDAIRDAVFGLKALGFVGANVTIPYKQAVIPWMNSLSPRALEAYSVNTIIVNDDKSLHGDSTDGEAFMRDLKHNGFHDVNNKNVAIIGAGGASRSIACALIKANCARLCIFNRNHDNAERLVQDLRINFPRADLLHDDLAALSTTAMNKYDLVVNCTPPNTVENIRFASNNFVYDTNYMDDAINMQEASLKAKAFFVKGRGMLLHAGALSFSSFTGHAAPLGVMSAEI